MRLYSLSFGYEGNEGVAPEQISNKKPLGNSEHRVSKGACCYRESMNVTLGIVGAKCRSIAREEFLMSDC